MTRILNKNIPIITKKESNFQYIEFVKSDIAIRWGIDNTPNDEQWECIEALTQHILQPVRDNFGRLRITSGFRSPELCIKIKSAITSNHTRGQAADIETPDGEIKLFDIFEWIHDNCEFRELIAEFFPNGWIHVAYREGANNKTIRLKDKNHHYLRCDIDYIRKIYG